MDLGIVPTVPNVNLLWFPIIIAFEISSIIGGTTTNTTACNATAAGNKTEEQSKNFTEIFNENGSIHSNTHQPLVSSTTNPTIVTLTTLSDTVNNMGSPDNYSKHVCKCGVASSASGKIVGGTPVNEQNFWPWFAALVRADRSTKVFCGASLISSRYLLTAAHCLLPMIQVGVRNFKVKLGYNELHEKNRNENETRAENDKFDVPIESVTVHPKYEQSFPYHYDIGLVKLSYAINCTNRVRPICLPSAAYHEKMYANETAITSGFGRTGVHGNYSEVLQQIRLKLISISECSQDYSKLHFKAPQLLDNMICAWGQGKDTCIGDSGGPLFLWRKANSTTTAGRNETSYFEQIGITSFGIGCANDKYPGVYSRVDKFLPWLNSVVNYDDF